MRKHTLVLAAVLAGVAMLAGSCRPEAGSKKRVVGFSQVGAESGWRTAESQSIRDEAAKRGIELKFSDAQQKQENQISAVRNFVTQGVDAIILAPVVKEGWDPVLQEAKSAKIPVILVDRGVSVQDESLYATLIASDFIEEGRMAGEWLAKKTNGQCVIVELQGTVGADPANDRKKGFEQAIAKYPGMQIIKSQSGDFRRDGGKNLMKTFLQTEGKKIQAVYAHNDEMALGAVQAIEEWGQAKPGVDILVVSIDGQQNALQALLEGKINCVVECDPMLGPAAFDAIEAILAGKPVEKRVVVKDRLFDASNVTRELVESRKY